MFSLRTILFITFLCVLIIFISYVKTLSVTSIEETFNTNLNSSPSKCS